MDQKFLIKKSNKELAKQKKQLGKQFDAYLAQQGLTEETAEETNP